MNHGGKKVICKQEGCVTTAQQRGLCAKHGGGKKKPCMEEGKGNDPRNEPLQ
jgi:hypothetical protein